MGGDFWGFLGFFFAIPKEFCKVKWWTVKRHQVVCQIICGPFWNGPLIFLCLCTTSFSLASGNDSGLDWVQRKGDNFCVSMVIGSLVGVPVCSWEVCFWLFLREVSILDLIGGIFKVTFSRLHRIKVKQLLSIFADLRDEKLG